MPKKKINDGKKKKDKFMPDKVCMLAVNHS